MRVDGWKSKVLQEVLADLKSSKMLQDHSIEVRKTCGTWDSSVLKRAKIKQKFAFYMPKYYFNITLKVRRLENGMLLPVVAVKGKTQFANVADFFF